MATKKKGQILDDPELNRRFQANPNLFSGYVAAGSPVSPVASTVSPAPSTGPRGINLTRVTQGNAQRGWTSGSIAPQPMANVGTSGNIPANIMQSIGNLSAQQALQQLFGNQNTGQQPQQQPMAAAATAPNPAAVWQAQSDQLQQAYARQREGEAQWNLNKLNQNLSQLPTYFGGISPMGDTTRANLMAQQQPFQNQLGMWGNGAAFVPQMSGWVGGF